jgi:lycopene cyclase domain-containing protein
LKPQALPRVVTYFRFHWIFNLPLLFILVLAGWAEPWTAGTGMAVGWVVLMAVAFTTPWDNVAARWGIWGFPRHKYTLRIGYLPVEEYLFFVLQSLNVMFGVRALLLLVPSWHRPGALPFSAATWVGAAIAVVAWIAAGLALRALGRRKGACLNYALHLAWFLPVISLQWIIAPALFLAHAGLLTVMACGFGLYYTLADLVAVRAGIWFFDEKQITGHKVAGLPWEEIAFFVLTSLLVAQSFLLLLPGDQR